MAFLRFPSLSELNLVLLSQALPANVQVTPCKAHQYADGVLVIETKARLARKTLQALSQFGVMTIQMPEEATVEPPLEVVCWHQLVPLREAALEGDEHKIVLFKVNSTERFAGLVGEMVRLGNDRIAYCAIERPTSGALLAKRKSELPPAMLVRVHEPPYYTLINVLDAADDSAIVAYHEQAPRVWVRLGYEHPLAERLEPPAGHLLLIDPPNHFEFIAETPFEDVYKAMDVRLPVPMQAWQAAKDPATIRVPLTLTQAGSTAAAQLWIIRQDALKQMQQLVERSDDSLLDQLAFAVVEQPSGPVVVLRVRTSRLDPPILVLNAVGYSTYLRLPNLFLPVGMRIQPPLRRDVIAKLLAPDSRQVVWLEADSSGASNRYLPFQSHAVPDAAFRPLRDWVEYVLDQAGQAMDTWIQSHRFEFDSFVCKDDVRQPLTPLPDPTAPTPEPSATELKPDNHRADARGEESDVPMVSPVDADFRRASTNKLVEQLKQTEAEFLESTAPLDASVRRPQWYKLAWLNAQLRHQLDATICWCNLLWYAEELRFERTQQWLQAELQSAGRESADLESIREIIRSHGKQSRDASLVAAFVIHCVVARERRTELRALAPELTRYFEQQERCMPVRLVWLIAMAMHELVAGDPLGVARVRDRLLDRLYQHGVVGEFDIASFLRGSLNQSDQHRAMRGRWQEIMATVLRWLNRPIGLHNQTKVYARFMFAYSLVRMGEVVSGRELFAQAAEEIDSKDTIHLWNWMAYYHRVEQAAQGGDNREPLPADLLRQLEHMDQQERYKVDRLRQTSRILEPYDRIEPYRRWHRNYKNEFIKSLAELKDSIDLKPVEAQLKSLLVEYPRGERGFQVLATALEYAPRLGDAFATELLDRVDRALGDSQDAIEKALLLQRALYVAAHFGHMPRVTKFMTRLSKEMPGIVDEYLRLDGQYNPKDKDRINTVESLLLHSFRGLRKLGLRDELAALYARIGQLVDAHEAAAIKARSKMSPTYDVQASKRLALWLCVASGYYYFGKAGQADEIVDQVRTFLLRGELVPVEQRRVANAYVVCCSLGNPEAALTRIWELFQRDAAGNRVLPKIGDTMSTGSHFSIAELELIENSLLSLLSDESGWDPRSQAWLDQDEFAIRKRIHHDMHQAQR